MNIHQSSPNSKAERVRDGLLALGCTAAWTPKELQLEYPLEGGQCPMEGGFVEALHPTMLEEQWGVKTGFGVDASFPERNLELVTYTARFLTASEVCLAIPIPVEVKIGEHPPIIHRDTENAEDFFNGWRGMNPLTHALVYHFDRPAGWPERSQPRFPEEMILGFLGWPEGSLDD